ncbi:MAG: ketopantoate reductase family protein [Candidatus Coproplasma sp.]
MRACIYGAGAMGTVLGAFITAGGGQIDLINRNRDHVAALKENGAHITGSVDFTVKVSALTPDEMTGKYDVIFLMTKRRDNALNAAYLCGFLAEGGVICTTQNGLPEDSVAQVAGRENVLGCAVSWGATFIGKGEAKLTSSPDKLTFALGSPYGDNSKTHMVKPYLELMGKVSVEHNFIGARWSKLIINSAFSSLSAVTGLTFGQVASGFRSRVIAQQLIREGAEVAYASGVKPAKIQGHDAVKLLDYKNPIKRAVSFALIPLAMKKHKNLVSGMYYDLAKGRQCDIDFICGEVERHGALAGVSTPYTSGVIALAHSIERGERAISPENLKELKF